MDKQLPVWRMNTGIEPKDKTGHVVFHGESNVVHDNNWSWMIYDEDCFEIYAYQTTRTKSAKYRGKNERVN